MPIYEYRCGDCGYQKEYLQRITDALLTVCPECGKRSFNKLVTAAGFQLKGTGWYATDFKNSGAKPAAKQDKAATTQDKAATTQDKAATTPDKAATTPDKAATTPDKAADSSSKESSKTDTSCGAGASPACN